MSVVSIILICHHAAMTTNRMTTGPTGATVRTNVRRLREDQGVTFAALARRLATLGSAIPALGLRRLEAGERRVDADDLAALAVALGTSPATLMMPEADRPGDAVPVTGSDGRVPAESVWDWLTAQLPLDLRVEHVVGADGEPVSASIDRDQFDHFRTRSRPRWRTWMGSHPTQAAVRQLEQTVDLALDPRGADRPWSSSATFRAMLAGDMRVQIDTLSRLATLLEADVEPRAGWPSTTEGGARGDR